MRASLIVSPPKGVTTAHELLKGFSGRCGEWCLDVLAGRYVEVRGGATSAVLTAVRGIVLEAQRRAELVAWIGKKDSMFFPPDFAAAGVDLEALLVVFAGGLNEGLRAADTLFRSGAFGVIVFDLGKDGPLPMAAQSRFAGLAKEYHTAFLEIAPAERGRSARGSLASLRVETKKERLDREHFRVETRALKDKQSVSGWTHKEICDGPDGLG
jgi:recombination protein RecA